MAYSESYDPIESTNAANDVIDKINNDIEIKGLIL